MNENNLAFARLADQARRRIQEISPHELARAKPVPVIIDVRESEEYADGYVALAKHLSRGVLEQKIADVSTDFSTPIVLYCDRGERAALADWKTSSKWATSTCIRSRVVCRTGSSPAASWKSLIAFAEGVDLLEGESSHRKIGTVLGQPRIGATKD